ncbi:protein mahjong-like isoform X1 [Artemia franciscana]|uniref:protein mahjong-like isoform X1 n=2 Tax=Artemia franciscana TaxID=6661 RepID=UPI0032DA7492
MKPITYIVISNSEWLLVASVFNMIQSMDDTIDTIYGCTTISTAILGTLFPMHYPGYDLRTKKRVLMGRGGVGFLVKNGLNYQERDDLSIWMEDESESETETEDEFEIEEIEAGTPGTSSSGQLITSSTDDEDYDGDEDDITTGDEDDGF